MGVADACQLWVTAHIVNSRLFEEGRGEEGAQEEEVAVLVRLSKLTLHLSAALGSANLEVVPSRLRAPAESNPMQASICEYDRNRCKSTNVQTGRENMPGSTPAALQRLCTRTQKCARWRRAEVSMRPRWQRRVAAVCFPLRPWAPRR